MPSRRKKTVPQDREFKLRLPPDVSKRIIDKAASTGWPQNRVIINELAAFPDLEQGGGNLAENVGKMSDVLAHYSSRIVMADLSDQLLQALDTALATEGSAQQAALDKVRVIRSAMLKTKTTTK